MSYFKKIFMRELEKTTNKLKLQILMSVANLLIRKDNKIFIKSVKYLDLTPLNRTVISPEVLTKTHLPNYTSTNMGNCIEVNSPEVQLLELENFIISGSSSSFINGNDLYIERYCNEENANANYNSGCLLSHNKKYAVVRQSAFSYVESAFFLSGNGSWNYYHWLIEILPKLQVYLELCLYKQDVKLLVPCEVKANENFNFLLNSILGDIKVDMIFVSRDFYLHVEHLYHLTPINNVLFNERKIGVSANILHLRYDSLAFIASKVQRFILSNDDGMFSAERVFLARKERGARSYNQSEIISFLMKYDFKIIYMEEHDIKQQIFIFKNAKYIVGASGAAWSNLIFCNSSCKALTWLPELIQNFPVFSSLANFSNVELSFFNTPSNHYETIHDNYVIDMNMFEEQVSQLLK